MSMMLCGETLGVCSFGIVKNIFNGEPCAKWIGIVHLHKAVHLQEVQVH